MNITTLSKKDLTGAFFSLVLLGALAAAVAGGTPPAIQAQTDGESYEQCDEILDPNDPSDCMFSITPALVGEEAAFTMAWSCPAGYTADIQAAHHYFENLDRSSSLALTADTSDTFQLFCRPGATTAGSDIPGVVGTYAFADAHAADNFELAIEGTHVFVRHEAYSEGAGDYVVSVDIFDVSDPEHMVLLGTYQPHGSYPYAIRVSGGYLYLLADEGVEIANVTSPSSPEYVTTYVSSVVDPIYAFEVSGNFLYVKGQDNRIGVVNVSNPAALAEVGTYNGNLDYYNDLFAAKGSALFLNGFYNGGEDSGFTYGNLLQVVSAASPAPSLIAQLQAGIKFEFDQTFSHPIISGNYLYADAYKDENNDDYSTALVALDITNPSSPQVAFDERLNPLGGSFGNILKAYPPYLITNDDEDQRKFNIYDISDPIHPSFEKSIFSLGFPPKDGNDEGASIKDIVGRGEYLFAISYDNDPGIAPGNEIPRLYAIHVPSYTGETAGASYNQYPLDVPEGFGSLEAFGQNSVYAASGGHDSIVSIDVSNPAAPVKNSRYPSLGGSNSWDTWSRLSGSVLYTNVGSEGVLAINVADPKHPAKLSEMATGPVEDGTVAGNRMYLASPYYEGGGVSIYNVTNPSSPTLLGAYDSSSGYLDRLVASGQYLYGINDNGRPEIIDVSNPANPVLASEVDLGDYGTAKELMVLSGYLYVFGWDNVLRVLDVSDHTSPVEVSSYIANDSGNGFISGSLLYYVDNTGITVLNISSPAQNLQDGQLPVVGSYHDVSGVEYAGHSGSYVFLRTNEGDSSVVTIVDISNPAHPVGAHEYDAPGYMDGSLFGTDQYLYVIDPDSGVFRSIDIDSLPVPASSLALHGIESLAVGEVDYSLYTNDSELYESAASQVYWQFGPSVSSCTIEGPNVSTTTTISEGSASTGQLYLSNAVDGVVTYTMQCMGGETQFSPISATIHIIPGCYPASQVCLFKAEPGTVLSGQPSTLTWSCPTGDTSSVGSNFATGDLAHGSQQVTPADTTAYDLECAPSGARGEVTVTVPEDHLQISSVTKTIRRGTATTLSWNAHNVIPGSCTLSGNGISLSDSANSGDPAQGYVWTGTTPSGIIAHATNYLLSCETATGPVTKLYTIGIVPTYQER
jgi:hypothetical protein